LGDFERGGRAIAFNSWKTRITEEVPCTNTSKRGRTSLPLPKKKNITKNTHCVDSSSRFVRRGGEERQATMYSMRLAVSFVSATLNGYAATAELSKKEGGRAITEMICRQLVISFSFKVNNSSILTLKSSRGDGVFYRDKHVRNSLPAVISFRKKSLQSPNFSTNNPSIPHKLSVSSDQ